MDQTLAGVQSPRLIRGSPHRVRIRHVGPGPAHALCGAGLHGGRPSGDCIQNTGSPRCWIPAPCASAKSSVGNEGSQGAINASDA